MRKISIAVLIVFAVVGGVVGIASPASAVIQGGTCNGFAGASALGSSYSDSQITVPACGPEPGTGTGPNVYPYPGALAVGGYQCMEFSERYLYYKFGVTMNVSTNGSQVVSHYAARYPSMFSVVVNGAPNSAPVQGDVISFSMTTGFSDSGHTGVVQSSNVNSSGDGTVVMIEQNDTGSSGRRGFANIPVTNWRLSFNGFTSIEWLHARASSQQAPQQLGLAFQANTGAMWSVENGLVASTTLGLMPGTSPAIAHLSNGGYEIAFQANNGSLWTVGSDQHGSWNLGMMAGTSPSIAATANGGYEVAFQANTGGLWTVGATNTAWNLGMMAGTSPSITTLANGAYEVAFQANTGSLWTVGATNTSWNLGMTAGTSPSISAAANGGYEVAFQANSGTLWTVGATNTSWNLGMMAGSSPAIASTANGGYEVAFQANTGSLWTVGSDQHGSWNLGMMPGTSPSIASTANGGYEVAFQANTGSLWTIGSDQHGSWNLGMMAGTNPAITN